MLKTFKLGNIRTNVYIWWDKKISHGFIIDPAIPSSELNEFILNNKINIKYILLTHGHFDHTCGIADILKITQAKVAMNPVDLEIKKRYKSLAMMSGYKLMDYKIDIKLKDNDEFKIGENVIRVICTPGHSKGGVCFYLESEKILFSGDTLFHNVHGRTDLPESDILEMKTSLKKILQIIPEDTRVLPGHGKETTIKQEKLFFRNLL